MSKPLALATLALLAAGCAVHAVQTKTLTIPPQKETVIVTSQCHSTSTDYMFIHTAKAQVSMTTSNGKSTEELAAAQEPQRPAK